MSQTEVAPAGLDRLRRSACAFANVLVYVLFIFALCASFRLQRYGYLNPDLLTLLLFWTSILLVHIGIAGLQFRRQGRELKREAHWVLSDKKLDLLMDEVVELREALHEHRVVEQADNPELTTERLRGHSQEDLDEMILLEEYQAVKATMGS